jgi:membrane protein required for colicin V production
MNVFDILITVILCYFGYKGYKNGLMRELGSLISLIAGIFLAIRFSDLINDLISNNTSIDSNYIPVISFAIIFIAVVVVVLVFSKLLDRFVKVIKLDWLNKIAGVAFALLKTILILGGLFFLLIQTVNKLGIIEESFFNKSFLFRTLTDVFEFAFPYLDHLMV